MGMEKDWLDQWDAERKAATEKPPTGYYTVAQIAKRLNMPETTALSLLRARIRDGTMQCRQFRVMSRGGKLTLINHYGPTAAPSASTKKASRRAL